VNEAVPEPDPVLGVALGAVWLVIAVKSGVIPLTRVVNVVSAPNNPKVAVGVGTEVESTARTWMVAMLGIELVEAAAVLLVVSVTLLEEVGSVKDRRTAQVAGSSPYVVVRYRRVGRRG
jgi:hypothetical protein